MRLRSLGHRPNLKKIVHASARKQILPQRMNFTLIIYLCFEKEILKNIKHFVLTLENPNAE